MKIIIFIILTFISSNLSAQNIETYYFDVAQELGHCYERLTAIEGDSGYYYPLCSDSVVRVFWNQIIIVFIMRMQVGVAPVVVI